MSGTNGRFAALGRLKSGNGGAIKPQSNKFDSLAQMLNSQRKTEGGKNALTSVTKDHYNVTDYLKQNQGYAKLVGVQFDGEGKVYTYLDPKGTVRTGDTPTVEVTHHVTNRNSFVPGKHTRVVNTGKGGISNNTETLGKITNKNINLKTIQSQNALRGLAEHDSSAPTPKIARVSNNRTGRQKTNNNNRPNGGGVQ
jgi:hypothetical protein